MGYPLDRLYEEVAYIAYHFHWSREEVLVMEHRERQAWVEQIAALNQRINAAAEGEREGLTMDEPREPEPRADEAAEELIDIEALAAAVERLLRRDLEIARERSRGGPSTLIRR